MPMMAFMGVRISWLTLARKSSLARLAPSAGSLAWPSPSSCPCRSEASWPAAMAVPYDADLGVHQQAAGFTHHEPWSFADTPPEKYPLLLHYPYFDLYRKQVVKQADLTLAMHWCGDAFTPEEKARNFAYYEAITVRDSSLSSCSQAVMAAEGGHLDLAYDYPAEAVLMALDAPHHDPREGLHIAPLAGGWLGLVAGLGGFRDHGPVPEFAPRLPDGLTRLEFSLTWRGLRLRVEVDHATATYSLRDGTGTLDLVHHGDPVQVTATGPVIRQIPAI